MNLDLAALREGYRDGHFAPAGVIREVYRRIGGRGERPAWIHVIPEEETTVRAEALGPFREDLPLYGVPFAIKDNIDLAGIPTTAACPAFAYTPRRSATVVSKLIAAGAIPIGKTNLDQFAIGLVGTRSAYGACSSVFDDDYIAGGSSSGSAVAVAAGLVSFALGTDVEGSGCVPAAFNGIVGMKPTRGSIGMAGAVPACRSLDCISIFALNCGDAEQVFECARGFDAADPWSRHAAQARAWSPRRFRFGVPRPELLHFFGDASAPKVFEEAAVCLESLGGTRIGIAFEIFRDAAQLFHSGPWAAERLSGIREFAQEHAASLHPLIAHALTGADSIGAVSAFAAMHRLKEISRAAESEWARMDLMLLPTAGNCYTHEQIEASPIARNANLGYYTSFINLLDLAAISVPAGKRGNGMPFGVTLMAPAWSDSALLRVADRLHRSYEDLEDDSDDTESAREPYCPAGYVPFAACGPPQASASLSPLLTEAGAFLIEASRTAANYRLCSPDETRPSKPALAFDSRSGVAVDVDVWAVPETRLGRLIAAASSPLAIGTCILESGRVVKSFVCEPYGRDDADDVTHPPASPGARRRYASLTTK